VGKNPTGIDRAARGHAPCEFADRHAWTAASLSAVHARGWWFGGWWADSTTLLSGERGNRLATVDLWVVALDRVVVGGTEVDADRPRLLLLGLGDADLQDAAIEMGADAVRVDASGQSQ